MDSLWDVRGLRKEESMGSGPLESKSESTPFLQNGKRLQQQQGKLLALSHFRKLHPTNNKLFLLPAYKTAPLQWEAAQAKGAAW